MDNRSESRQRPDFIVIGSGIAGLRAALELAGRGSVVVLTKDSVEDSSTEAAQGGVAVALSDEDRVGFHLEDTLQAGDGLCDEQMVRILVEEGPAYVTELIAWGTKFDREGLRLAFTREGAHSRRRILHAHGDSTGKEIVRILARLARAQPGIGILDRAFTLDLILHGGRCVGVTYIDSGQRRRRLLGRAVLLATGGAGRVYAQTTNPPQATGDGMAIAFRAGAEMMDMEFVQFHPTALALPGAPPFLLSESIRGEGGVLRNGAGERFMLRHHPQAELAPRDVVSRAILDELKRTGEEHVLLDLTDLDGDFVRRRFPTILATCASYGVDITRERIPVTPAAHYMMGGVRTDAHGRTSVPGLYAAGEVACTGVHGANRLASNSLLEGLVFGGRSARAMLGDEHPLPEAEGLPAGGAASGGASGDAAPAAGDPAAEPRPAIAAEQRLLAGIGSDVRRILWRKVGITRCAESLEQALDALRELSWSEGFAPRCRPGLEALNLLTIGALIARAGLRRTESRGSHYRTDHPQRDDGRWQRHAVLTAAEMTDLRLFP